ncbi:MAG TPA: 16S rRNA (guanine(527)-N(7))-methyltransferase RsmG [Candidatus Limnocylindrales bacterium]|nr:16S rRNA (guanine(527)-N(7))-methyltransferase RsmG [Candidatus Limnocylindrales bacterium]
MDAADRSSLPRPTSPSSEPRPALPRSAEGLPALDPVFWAAIDEGLRHIPLELSASLRAALDGHGRLLVAWNAAINLTAMRSAEQIARGHVLDSLLAVPALRVLAGDRPGILDIGSGAGYPGLPLALALPAGRAALVDSIGKKATFLEVAAAVASSTLTEAGESPPQIVALAERAEDLAQEPDHRESWELVVARAVGSIAEVAELGLPLARRGGHVVIWKLDAGDGSLGAELKAARDVVNAAGGARPRIVRLAGAADLGLDGHCLVVIDKQRPTPDRYPRTAGERRRAALR